MIEKRILQQVERAERMRVKEMLQKKALEERELTRTSYTEALRLARVKGEGSKFIFEYHKRYLPSDSPLSYAVRKRNFALLTLILSSPGFNADNYENPIGSAMNIRVFKMLVNAGFKVNGQIKNIKGLKTYLHQTVFNGNIGMVKSMLDAGCDIEGSDIMYMANGPEMLAMLLEYGFDMNLKGIFGKPPVSCFIMFNGTSSGSKYSEMVEMIIKAGCDCNIQDSTEFGDYPLHEACKLKVNPPDAKNPYFPLSWKLCLIKLLIECGGADITLQNKNGKIASECIDPSEYDIKDYLDNAYDIRFNHSFKR